MLSLAHYLGQGWEASHGISRGPMADVTANLSGAPEADVRAIASYVARLMSEHPTPMRGEVMRPVRSERVSATADSMVVISSVPSAAPGAALYASACGTCHETSRPQPYGGLAFHLSTAVNAPDPTNIINVVLLGLNSPAGERGPIMPAFGGAITDPQLVELLRFMRATFSTAPAWSNLEVLVARQRGRLEAIERVPTHGSEGARPPESGTP